MRQIDLIIRHLEDYGSITPVEAMSEYGIMRLASRMSDLKREGYPFTVEIVRGKNRYGETTHYAKYKKVAAPEGATPNTRSVYHS